MEWRGADREEVENFVDVGGCAGRGLWRQLGQPCSRTCLHRSKHPQLYPLTLLCRAATTQPRHGLNASACLLILATEACGLYLGRHALCLLSLYHLLLQFHTTQTGQPFTSQGYTQDEADLAEEAAALSRQHSHHHSLCCLLQTGPLRLQARRTCNNPIMM